MNEIPISQIANHVGTEINQKIRAVKISLMNGVVRDTRVDTGRLRGNWQTTTGAMAEGEIDRLDPSGMMSRMDVEAGVQGDTLDYLTNNLPYAEVWEERDGMVARNVARLERILREESRD